MPRKVIVIGLDGLEPKVIDALIARGEMPAIRSLSDGGPVRRIETTFPAQTPVAWSTFSTGVNPGGHGIYDFIHRDPKTYLPRLSLNTYEQPSIFLPPRAVNLRKGVPVWKRLGDHGVPSVVLRCPATYPAEDLRGRMLSGMGVPDILGGLGTGTYYTTDRGAQTAESEALVLLDRGRDPIDTELLGPYKPGRGRRVSIPMRIVIGADRSSLDIHTAGEPRTLKVHMGEWSPWLKLKFSLGPLQSVRAMVRFFLVAVEPELRLYASPVNFDPAKPMFPISSPPDYAKDLESRLGAYYTTGMVEDHGALNNGRIDEDAFLNQCSLVMNERERMLTGELERMKEGFLFCLFDTPDRLQHMMWRFGDPKHPLFTQEGKERYGSAIEEHYRECDAVVGRVMNYVDDETVLVVLSDHGFAGFRRGVELNAWLAANGWLRPKPGVQGGDKRETDMLRGVDWSETKAYAVGLGAIYLNVRGRESNGILDPAEAPLVRRQIAEQLSGLIDPATGDVAIRRVLARDEIYSGPLADEAPDLLVQCNDGYRVDWGTALGGIGRNVFEDNRHAWSGDHIIDATLVPGFVAANVPLRTSDIRMVDMYPSILHALQAPVPDDSEGSLAWTET